MKKIALIVLSCLSTFTCFAFESNGFKTGMSIEMAKQSISTKGMNVRGLVIDGRTNNTNGFEQLAFYKGADKTDWGGVVAFCNDKLYFYSHSLDFDLDFANALEKMLDQYGPPTSVRSYRSDYYDKPLFKSQIDFVWKKGDDEIRATVLPEKKSPEGKILVSRTVNVTYVSASLNKLCFK
jgi:hypothetical protein